MLSRILIKNVFLIAFFGFNLGLTSCTGNKTPEPAAPRQVNLSTWSNYIDPEVQKLFTEKTGIQLNISYYASNEELLAKVQAGATGIDIAMPSDYMVAVMSHLDFLQKLDPQKIPNRTGLDPQFLKQDFDLDNSYSYPYAWSTTGIAIHRDLYKGTITGWKDFFTNKDLAGKISILDDVRETMAAALKLNGYSVNSIKPDELKKAADSLKELKPRLKMFNSDLKDSLLNKEVAVAQIYSTDGLRAQSASHGKIEYILPVEGGTRAIDNMVILKNAKNVEEAHALINFLLSPEANLIFVKKFFGGPVLKATKDLLPPDLKNSKVIFPHADVLKKFEGIKDLGENTKLYDRLWTEIKSQ